MSTKFCLFEDRFWIERGKREEAGACLRSALLGLGEMAK